MRFAYLSADFGVRPFGASGGSVHVRETVRALRRLGHEVEVFAPDLGADGAAPEEGYFAVPLEGLGRETARLLPKEPRVTEPHLAREWRRIVYAEQLQRRLVERFDARPPDVLYERYSLFAYAGLELSLRYGCPLLLEVNAPLCHEAATYRELVLSRTARDLERRILGGADAVFVVSRALVDHARRLGVPAERIQVLPNGVDPERFHPRVRGDALRARFGLEGRRVAGFVGTLRPWHDLDTLLAATGLLAQEDPELRLLVVGAGPGLERLRAEAGPRVVCTGALAHDEVPAALAAMDVVVVPYAKGGDEYFSPLKLFEAMAAGRPVVGARIGQVAEAVCHGETGLLYEPGHAEDLAAQLRSVFARPDWAAGLGGAGRAWVECERAWDANARSIAACAGVSRERRRAS